MALAALIFSLLALSVALVAAWCARPRDPLDVGTLGGPESILQNGGEPMERVAADLVRLPVVEQPKPKTRRRRKPAARKTAGKA